MWFKKPCTVSEAHITVGLCEIAQQVEQMNVNHCVTGSIPVHATIKMNVKNAKTPRDSENKTQRCEIKWLNRPHSSENG